MISISILEDIQSHPQQAQRLIVRLSDIISDRYINFVILIIS